MRRDHVSHATIQKCFDKTWAVMASLSPRVQNDEAVFLVALVKHPRAGRPRTECIGLLQGALHDQDG